MCTDDSSRQQSQFLDAAAVAARRQLFRTMSSMVSATDECVPDCYDRMVAAAEQAFRAEEQLAEADSLGALHDELELQGRALSALHQAASRIDHGDVALAHEALRLLTRFLIARRDHASLAKKPTETLN